MDIGRGEEEAGPKIEAKTEGDETFLLQNPSGRKPDLNLSSMRLRSIIFTTPTPRTPLHPRPGITRRSQRNNRTKPTAP